MLDLQRKLAARQRATFYRSRPPSNWQSREPSRLCKAEALAATASCNNRKQTLGAESRQRVGASQSATGTLSFWQLKVRVSWLQMVSWHRILAPAFGQDISTRFPMHCVIAQCQPQNWFYSLGLWESGQSMRAGVGALGCLCPKKIPKHVRDVEATGMLVPCRELPSWFC